MIKLKVKNDNWNHKVKMMYVIRTLSNFDRSISITKLSQEANMARNTIKKIIDVECVMFKTTTTAENRTYVELNRSSNEVQDILSVMKFFFDEEQDGFNIVV